MIRRASAILTVLLAVWSAAAVAADADSPAAGRLAPGRYLRFQKGATIAYGVLEGDRVRQLSGDLFHAPKKTDVTYPLADVTILVPTTPRNVLALAGNYRDHLGTVPVPAHPEPFLKLPSCLQRHEGPIVQPASTEPVHYEGELVIVIGRRARNVPEAEALNYVLGITCGNDVSARVWQKNDRQWWRAKASDTFGPCGPFIAAGLDYDRLALELRVDGQVKQKANTSDMIHNCAQTVSFISRSVTLEPGDLIYTGTPGKTEGMKLGATVEVEIEGVGVLRNRVVAQDSPTSAD